MQKYTFFEKILHKQFLGETSLSHFLYERIIKKADCNRKYNHQNNVFITGLARSGTTALLNKIYSSGEIPSLLYKYMPFILSPKLAHFFSKKVNSSYALEYTERYHNDGIKISNNSPECLDEVYWMKSNPEYIQKDFIKNINITDLQLNGYGLFLSNYANLNDSNRILIKNNNHHLRINKLSSYFPKSYFLIMMRDPISHAESLLKQHLNFLYLQKIDPFILQYMNLIGHFEFGFNSKSFVYKSEENNWYENLNKCKIEYWLLQWIQTYKWILNSNFLINNNVFIISYEKLCKWENLYPKICKLIDIKNYKSGVPFILSNKENNNLISSNINNEVIDMAYDIHNKLNKFSISKD